MKLIIASDIHGSAKYCSLLLDAVKSENVDKLILLGDILYHGPRNPLPEGYAPLQVCELLASIKQQIICVKGNCDAEIDQVLLPFTLADTAYLNIDGLDIYLGHGHKKQPHLCEGDIYISGHTHVPVCISENGYTQLNPGSVALPKENSSCGYILYENRKFTHVTFDGERQTLLDADDKTAMNKPTSMMKVPTVRRRIIRKRV